MVVLRPGRLNTFRRSNQRLGACVHPSDLLLHFLFNVEILGKFQNPGYLPSKYKNLMAAKHLTKGMPLAFISSGDVTAYSRLVKKAEPIGIR